MTIEEYDNFLAVVEGSGYERCDLSPVKNEDFYFYKSFHKTEDSDGYQVLFLVWDRSDWNVSDGCKMGVSPLILTGSDDWPRIDLELTVQDFDVDKVEEYAEMFYKVCVL